MSYLLENVNHLDRVQSVLDEVTDPIAVTAQSRGGLVLVNQHYSDLIAPGSRLMWPQGFQCEAIYAVGAVEICTLRSRLARQHSMAHRIMELSILGRILHNFDPTVRAGLLVNWLCQRLGLDVVKQSNLDLLGSLGRVRSQHLEAAIRQYEQHLQHLGQTERLSDQFYLAWLRQQLALTDLALDLPSEQNLTPDIDFYAVMEFAPGQVGPAKAEELVTASEALA